MATITGGPNSDNLHGTPQADTIFGLSGGDVIDGRDGDDTIYGGNGGNYDSIYGGDGNDEIYGEDEGDILIGGQPQRDAVYREHGTQDNDEIFGGRGDDAIIGGPGDNLLAGQAGADHFYIGMSGPVAVQPDLVQRDTIVDFDPTQDVIHVASTLWNQRSAPQVIDGDMYLSFARPAGSPVELVILNYTTFDESDFMPL